MRGRGGASVAAGPLQGNESHTPLCWLALFFALISLDLKPPLQQQRALPALCSTGAGATQPPPRRQPVFFFFSFRFLSCRIYLLAAVILLDCD